MDTHENEVEAEDLPGHGILDEDFARGMLRDGEESGMLIWDAEESTYTLSARMQMFAVGQAVCAASRDIDQDAGPDDILQAILKCVPWVGGYELRGFDPDTQEEVVRIREGDCNLLDTILDSHRDESGAIPLPESWDVPDTLPNDWK